MPEKGWLNSADKKGTEMSRWVIQSSSHGPDDTRDDEALNLFSNIKLFSNKHGNTVA